jgi:hypothetical protein
MVEVVLKGLEPAAFECILRHCYVQELDWDKVLLNQQFKMLLTAARECMGLLLCCLLLRCVDL